jgi:aspartate racemase
MNLKTVGIIGGMGAAATADLFGKIVALTDAKRDSEHIPLLIDNNTQIPDRTAFLLGKSTENPYNELTKSAKRLKNMGADVIAVACNTSHYWIDDIYKAVDCDMISMLELVPVEAVKRKYRSIAILGTEGFVHYVRTSHYDKFDIEVMFPATDEQKCVNSVIYDCVKAGKEDPTVTEKFVTMLERMESCGVQSFALCCTELPIAFKRFGINKPYIDSTEVLAKQIILEAGGKLKT